jgi:acetyltransferase-like isoleucine patch superfamily enzyme
MGIVARLQRLANELPRLIGYRLGPRIMSELRKRWVLMRHPHADIRFEGPVYIGPGFSLDIPDGGTFIVGPGVEFRRNFRAEIAGNGRIVIGAGSYLTYGVLLACSTSIEIGERCGLAHCCSVFDGNHRYRDITVPFLEQGYDHRPIRLADDVQVHQLCTIINDIAERAVIGANSVVTRPVPAYTLAAGAPARPIKYFGPEAQRPPEVSTSARDGERDPR